MRTTSTISAGVCFATVTFGGAGCATDHTQSSRSSEVATDISALNAPPLDPEDHVVLRLGTEGTYSVERSSPYDPEIGQRDQIFREAAQSGISGLGSLITLRDANSQPTDEEYAAMRRAWEKADANHDGILSPEEERALLDAVVNEDGLLGVKKGAGIISIDELIGDRKIDNSVGPSATK